MFNSALDHMF